MAFGNLADVPCDALQNADMEEPIKLTLKSSFFRNDRLSKNGKNESKQFR